LTYGPALLGLRWSWYDIYFVLCHRTGKSMNSDALSPTVSWLSDEDLAKIYTSAYWNDIEEEKKKEWWILDNNYNKLWSYLNNTRLLHDYYAAEDFFKKEFDSQATIVDLAAGIGWTSVLLSKLNNVSEVHSVEISKHRIDLIMPAALEMFQGNPNKLKRYVGSFYKTKFDRDSMDAVFLSQAFHHAERPFFLLLEIHRILKINGVAFIFGEHYIDFKRIFRRFISSIIKDRKITFEFRELFRPDQVLGDHYYRVSDYFFMAEATGFACQVERLPSGDAMFILKKL